MLKIIHFMFNVDINFKILWNFYVKLIDKMIPCQLLVLLDKF
jgi:hypothetical protein